MKILLDAHISLAVAEVLRGEGFDAVALSEWNGGVFRTADDEVVLAMAYSEPRVLLTYDLATIPSILTSLMTLDQHHAGVVLADRRTVRPDDVGRLVRALRYLVRHFGEDNWEDQIVFLDKKWLLSED
jgi:predicted nuclease of predicted toxin-antitoxin system